MRKLGNTWKIKLVLRELPSSEDKYINPLEACAMLNLVYQDNSYELLNILIYKTPFGKFKKKLKRAFLLDFIMQ